MLSSGFVVAVMQITAFVGLNKMIPQLPDFMKSAIFTPFGNIFSSIVFLTALMPFLVEKVINRKELADRILSAIVSLIFMVSIASSVYLILPGKESSISILDYKNQLVNCNRFIKNKSFDWSWTWKLQSGVYPI